jgi:4-amino-4-deoxy-L-arabinose transferase-like glycosyltransferase
VLAAFLARLTLRLAYGEDHFWKHSYSLFYELAQSVARGQGLCYEWVGTKCGHRPPVYPLFLLLAMPGGKPFLAIVILQSLIGAGTALCAYSIGRELFDKTTGVLVALGVAFYPYFVMHDTALQETALFTFLTALAVLFFLKSRQSTSKGTLIVAGMALGLAVLTRATLLIFVPLAFLWIVLVAGQTRREAAGKAAVIAVAFLLVVGPWLARNYYVLGQPTFSTLTGLTLWAGNNPYSFTRYPAESIDRSVDEAILKLGPEERKQIDELSTDEVAQNSWFVQKGVNYIKEHPGETLNRAFKKVGAAYSWRLNPPSSRFAQLAYFLSYTPLLILGVVGAWLGRRNWPEHSLIYALFISFTGVTAIFFAHTSHRSYLDVYLIIFAANTISVLWTYVRQRTRRVRSSALEPAAS